MDWMEGYGPYNQYDSPEEEARYNFQPPAEVEAYDPWQGQWKSGQPLVGPGAEAWRYDSSKTPTTSAGEGKEWYWSPPDGARHGQWMTRDIKKPGPTNEGDPETTDDWGYSVRPFQASDATLPGWMRPPGSSFQIAPAPKLSLPEFVTPTAEGMFDDPSYKFRVEQGVKAMENSAAGRGVARTGGTLKAFQDYGQNMASQEFGNIWGRAMDKWNADMRKTLEEYQPTFSEWQIGQQAGQRESERALEQAWREYLTAYDMFRDQQDSVFNKNLAVTQVGASAN